MAAHIPLPDSPAISSSSKLLSPTQADQTSYSNRTSLDQPDLNPTIQETNQEATHRLTLDLVVQTLLPIICGKNTLLSLYETLNELSQQPNTSLTDTAYELLKALNDRQDHLDRLKVCDPSSSSESSTHHLSAGQPRPDPPDQSAAVKPDDKQSTEATELELESLKTKLKQEEEKRAKSISLLRAVRQKLMQTEKDKAGFENELNQLKSSTTTKIEELQTSRKSLEDELSRIKIFHEQQLSKLRHSYERETQSIRTQSERDAATKKSQFELELITTKASHERELTNRTQKITQLEGRLKELSTDRDRLFDQLQNRQEELEVALAQQDEIKGSMGELEHQLNESQNRIEALLEQVDHLKNSRSSPDRNELEIRKSIQELEQQHLSKTNTLQLRINQLEKERADVEQELGDSLRERLEQIETLRTEARLKSLEYADSLQSMAKRNEEILKSDTERDLLKSQLERAEQARDSQMSMVASLTQQLEELQSRVNIQTQELVSLKEDLAETSRRENELKSQNRTLRANEMKRVNEVKELFLRGGVDQNQRKEGVGYFANFSKQPPRSPSHQNLRTSHAISNHNPTKHSDEIINHDFEGNGVTGQRSQNMEDHHQGASTPSGKESEGSIGDQLKTSIKLQERSPTIHPNSSQADLHQSHDKSVSDCPRFSSLAEDEAELNFEYLRNTLLQFLEHKEMRPHLVRVLGVILHFTPQEIRRLAAKV